MVEKTLISSEQIAQARKLEGIFSPHSFVQREMKRQRDNPGIDLSFDNISRFVHYTSAESALKIIGSKRLWMRSTTCMIDYREVEHGHDLLVNYFATEGKRDAFIVACDGVVPGVAREVLGTFDNFWADIRMKTFITCVSEHDTAEDNFGRLSMWRAFGAHPRVVLVFNVPWGTPAALALGLNFSPVSYLDKISAHRAFDNAVLNITSDRAYLNALPAGKFREMLFYMLLNIVSCMKHEGFQEEREWRGVYTTAFNTVSGLLERSIECVDGIPQAVYKIPFDEKASPDLTDLDLSRILSRVIIGPTQFGWAMYDAFVGALSTLGVPDASAKVWASDLPIRS